MHGLKSAQDAVDVLNELLAADPDATVALMNARVPCNEIVAGHPSIQVGSGGEGAEQTGFRVGILGIINGIFVRHEGGTMGFIYAECDTDPETRLITSIKRFTLTLK